MEYIFEGICQVDDGKKFINIPFNVWEVCNDNVGEIPVAVTVDGTITYECQLAHMKNGYYNIPLEDAAVAELAEGNSYNICFSILGEENKKESSPYSIENPIRKIDGVGILIQPWDGLCGQTVFAMLAGVDIDEASEIMHCREWQANMAKIVTSLDYVGIPHSGQIIYTKGKDVELPKCCIIMENLGRFSHYLVGYDGKYYDPNNGIMATMDKSNIKGYLEILCD